MILVGSYVVNSLHLFGLVLTACLAVFYARRPLKHLIVGAGNKLKNVRVFPVEQREADMSASENNSNSARWRCGLVLIVLGLTGITISLMPWSASIGNYGTLMAIPDREAVVRAPESATLIDVSVQPGDDVSTGTTLGRMGNLGVEEDIVQVQSELARVLAEENRLIGQQRLHKEEAARSELQLRQRETEYYEIDSEERQINEHGGTMLPSSMAPTTTFAHLDVSNIQTETSMSTVVPGSNYPAALAVFQADIDSRSVKLSEAETSLSRIRQLATQGLIPQSELDSAETRAATSATELAAAKSRLESALIDHRQKHVRTATEMNLASSDRRIATLQAARLGTEAASLSAVVVALQTHRDLLVRKQAQFALVTNRGGTVFGEELPRMIGRYFEKGAEICRVANISQLLLRIQVPERELGDVRVGHPVRLRTRAYPDRVFRGVVSKIGGESESDQNGQATYRVELIIENSDNQLRPGMTAFARIEFGRQAIVRILLHKVRQALRPELWML